MEDQHKPYISDETKLPEITIKAFILGALLSVLLSAANAYLGLFAGLTVSASIPAAVLSMAILRLFRKYNILENNIVQTAASAGESLAAGVIFTFPALVLMGYWTEFNYWETVLIALAGGILGVLFTVPLRSALIVKQKLQFPEGVATAELLKTGEKGADSVRFLIWGAAIGAAIKIGEAGLKLWASVTEGATIFGKSTYAYFGMNLSPALIAVGYIVGFHISSLVFIGGAISWWIAIPIIIMSQGGVPEGLGLVDYGYEIWTTKIRYLGVGAMLIGGIWALISLRSSISFAFKNGLEAVKNQKAGIVQKRTEQDAPMKWVIIAIGAMIVPIFIIYLREIEDVSISAFMAIIMLFAGFLFSAVAGYMAGLVGSSNNPISGVTIATILTSALILVALMGSDSAKGPAAAIMIGAVVCCAAAIAGDNMQDLKAGYILGATPRNQQIMQMVGVISAALVMPFILQLLHSSFGFGPATAAHPDSLQAPQASLMASVAEGVFSGNLPWDMIWIGVAIGAVIIMIDQYQAKNGGARVPVLAVAVGLYLPFELDSAIMLGGILAYLIAQYQKANKEKVSDFEEAKENSNRSGLLLASGLITGEALIGIFIAGGIWVAGNGNFMALGSSESSTPGLILVTLLCFFILNIGRKAFKD